MPQGEVRTARSSISGDESNAAGSRLSEGEKDGGCGSGQFCE